MCPKWVDCPTCNKRYRWHKIFTINSRKFVTSAVAFFLHNANMYPPNIVHIYDWQQCFYKHRIENAYLIFLCLSRTLLQYITIKAAEGTETLNVCKIQKGSPSTPLGNGDIGDRSKCRQPELEWMKFLRAGIKLTSSGRADSKTFGPFFLRV